MCNVDQQFQLHQILRRELQYVKSACSEIMIALLPPSSNNDLPKRAPTAVPIALPILVEPVAEINGILESCAIHSPTSLSPFIKLLTPSGTLFFSKTSETICWQAIAHNGVFSTASKCKHRHKPMLSCCSNSKLQQEN